MFKIYCYGSTKINLVHTKIPYTFCNLVQICSKYFIFFHQQIHVCQVSKSGQSDGAFLSYILALVDASIIDELEAVVKYQMDSRDEFSER